MPDSSLPGRLGNPDLNFLEDPRLDHRIRAALEGVTMPGDLIDVPDLSATYEDIVDYVSALEEAFAVAHPVMEALMPKFDTVQSVETTTGADGNEIPLYIHLPKERAEPGPCIVHIHGGGMVMMMAKDPNFRRWRNAIAQRGIPVIGVEYRNGAGELGNHPFPAGLNDCATAVQWVYENRADLGVNSIVISGESGGGNLSLATTLKASKEGWLEKISGVYAMCPYISGRYADPPAELKSLDENDGYGMSRSMLSLMPGAYTPNRDDLANPLAWPYAASVEELSGLPPHVISVNELDPLRDEGLVYYRKLMAAGVTAMARTVHGTQHAGDLGFPDIAPDVYDETLSSLCRFAESVRPE
jgi:acetyl esterase/lipase